MDLNIVPMLSRDGIPSLLNRHREERSDPLMLFKAASPYLLGGDDIIYLQCPCITRFQLNTRTYYEYQASYHRWGLPRLYLQNGREKTRNDVV